MPYGSRVRAQNSQSYASRPTGGQRSYVPQQSGSKRHQYQQGAIAKVGQTLPAGEYFYFPIMSFARSKTGGASDIPLSATASNNYQTDKVFNGGRIVNYTGVIKIRNRGAIGIYLDIYQVAVSFYDVLVWNTLFATACPFNFDSTTTGPPDLRGAITGKVITTTLITKNTIKNFKFLQHYIQHIGTVYVTNEDGGNGGEVTLNINKIPPKCRRSQTGMMWALFFHNDSDSNGAETLSYDATLDSSFDEIPSDNRLPYID